MKGADVVAHDADADRLLALGEQVAEELALDCVLADVVRELDNRGIESLLLKGPALARWLYEDPNQRPYADIDLMVGPVQFDPAERCLEELGFRQDETDRHPHERADHHENWVSPGRYRAHVELHHTLFLLTAPPELVWERLNSGSERIEVAGTSVRVPGLIARVLIVVLHAAQHGSGAATPVQDLERAILSTSPDAWAETVKLARELDCFPAFTAGLQLTPRGRALARRLGIEPEGINRYLRLRMATAPDTAAGIDALLTTSGVLPRLRLIGQELVPTRSFMWANYSLAKRGPAGLAAAYVMRPVHLGIALPRGLMAWLRAAIPVRTPGAGRRGRINALSAPWSRRSKYDVVFYTPWIGSLLAPHRAVPPPGGAETQILLLSQALAERKLRVAIIVYGRSSELPDYVNGVKIIPRSPYRKRKAIGKLIEVLAIWRSVWKAPSRTVVYRAVGAELGLLAIYCRVARRRLVFSSANIVDFDCRRLLRKARDAYIYEFGVRRADEVVVQTEEQVAMCERRFARRPKLIKSLASVADRHSHHPEAFLWVGRLVDYKAPLEYVALARAMPEAKFWMIGVPSMDPSDHDLAAAVSAATDELPNLELLAPRPRAGVADLMVHAVASVNTAVYEGMPNVLLEAWAHGVPALVLEHDPGGVVMRYGLGGFAAGSRDQFLALAREQWELRNDRAARERVGNRCRSYIARRHTPGVVAERWHAVVRGRPDLQAPVGEGSTAECVA